MKIRNENQACTDEKRINQFLIESRIGYLGLNDEASPYVVPLNFVWTNGKIYFHGADSGRKAAILETEPIACFTVAHEYATLAHPVPAHTDTAYLSVMIFGQVKRLSDLGERTDAMQKLLDKYVPATSRIHLPRSMSKNIVPRLAAPLLSIL
ncbi:MAG: pyridoxamine 5'-phosphate oxidase family protein [Sporolactobacillus sp.]